MVSSQLGLSIYLVSGSKLSTVGEYRDQSEDDATRALLSKILHYVKGLYLGSTFQALFNEDMTFII